MGGTATDSNQAIRRASGQRARRRASFIAFAFALGLAALPATGAADDLPDSIPFAAQRPGDPVAGRQALLSKGWVGCGVPALYYDVVMALLPERLTPDFERLPNRPPGNEDLPFFLNRFRTKGGVEVLAPNCLYCHAGRLNGVLVEGLGNADGRFQVFGPQAARIARYLQWGSWLYFWSPDRRAEMRKVGDRMAAVAPYISVPIDGSNPTHNLAWALVVHHDVDTLAWSDAPLFALPPVDAPPADVPPWWRMRKKHAMFAAAGGQGDHTGFMTVNSALCADSVEDFEGFYDYFDDIYAYARSIQPPRYPGPIDAGLAAQGAAVFADHCQGCHGTYGPDEAAETYPNRLVALEKIGTDPALARYNVETSAPASEWLNHSVYTRKGEYHPYLGYVAPPLDGIWATAPFLHNGSVPTLAALLDSGSRPRFWTRSYDSRDYDWEAVGWQYQVLDAGQAGTSDPTARRRIVDTTLPGFSNAGHPYADHLDPTARHALLEYLKTL